VLLILYVILSLPCFMALSGYATSNLWLWFAVPLGAPHIGVWHAAGLSILISSILGMRGLDAANKKDKSKFELAIDYTLKSIIPPLVCLFFGWLVRFGM